MTPPSQPSPRARTALSALVLGLRPPARWEIYAPEVQGPGAGVINVVAGP